MRRLPVCGTSTMAETIPAKVGAPTSHFAIDGQCFAFLPITEPKVETVKLYRTRRAA